MKILDIITKIYYFTFDKMFFFLKFPNKAVKILNRLVKRVSCTEIIEPMHACILK